MLPVRAQTALKAEQMSKSIDRGRLLWIIVAGTLYFGMHCRDCIPKELGTLMQHFQTKTDMRLCACLNLNFIERLATQKVFKAGPRRF